MAEYLFSYGTLQKKEVQLQLFGRLLSGSKDTLKGYQLTTIEITDEAFLAKGEDKYQRTLIPSQNQNDTVEGTALELTAEELLSADKYEPGNYKRKQVIVASGKKAWIYVAVEIK